MKPLSSQFFDNSAEVILNDLDPSEILKPDEQYPIIGEAAGWVNPLQKHLAGLQRLGQCLENSMAIARYAQRPTFTVMGALRVVDFDGSSAYGFDCNPPHEFHVWLIDGANTRIIIDVGLPGVILRGRRARDEKGPFLTREPVILAGTPPPWLIYKPKFHFYAPTGFPEPGRIIDMMAS